jgi:hypothetical protein
LNAFCISSNQIVFSPSSFSEHTVTATVCLMHILKETGPADVLFQTQEASSHFRKELMDLLNRKFPEKLVRWGGTISWPPCSPDLIPLECFLLGVCPILRTRYRLLPVCRNLLDK